MADIRQHWLKAEAAMAAQNKSIVKPANSVAGGGTPFATGGNGFSSNATFSPRQLHQPRPLDRRKCMTNSRFLDNNLGIAGALNDGSVNYAIGSGIADYAATDDPEYDDSCNRFLDALFGDESFDVAEEHTFYDLQRPLARGMIVDGDSGYAKILTRDSKGSVAGTPQIQAFTSDQIDTSTNTQWAVQSAGPQWVDGIQRTSYGKALFYRVLKGDTRTPNVDYNAWWDYPARDFGLVLDRKRIGLSRGIPWSHRAQNQGQSMMNLGALAEAAEFVNALFAAIITTPGGETPEALEDFIVNSLGQVNNQKLDGTNEQKTVASKFVEIFGGGKIPVFPAGTKLEAYSSNRQPQTFTGFMDYLVTQLSLSYGIPPNFIWAIAGRNGPEARMTLAQASIYFNQIALIVINRLIKPVRKWCIQFGLLTGQINDGRLPRNGVSPYLARFHGPRDLTIDERYFHKTYLERLAAGQGTAEEYFALQGKDGETENRRRIKEIKKLKQLCVDDGVIYMGEFITTHSGQGASTQPAGDPATQEALQALADSAAKAA